MKPKPPRAYSAFVERFPELGAAWKQIQDAGEQSGPLDVKTCRLIKFGIALGAGQQGAAHSSVRKALALGIDRRELEQVVALAAGTLGMPAAVTGYCWVRDICDGE
jgi:alkylhydroperoxidase/carboxymuconolactone decarboxylase family protein YurZ